MKQKSLRKTSLVILLSISLGSFLYVNTDICLSGNRNLYKAAQSEAAICTDDDRAVAELPVPAVNMLARLWEVTRHFTTD